jgi:hypothetical protein
MGERFKTLDVASCTTGVLLNDMGGIYKVLTYVLDDPVFTHQLPAAAGAATPYLYAQHPWLETLDTPRRQDGETEGAFQARFAEWCRQLVAERGETIELEQPPQTGWIKGNAIRDAQDMLGPVFVVDLTKRQEGDE